MALSTNNSREPARPRLGFLLEVLRHLPAGPAPLWWWAALALAIHLEHREPSELLAFDLVMPDYAIQVVRRRRRRGHA